MSRTDKHDAAMKFIRINLLKYDFDDLVNEVKKKFNYSHYYAVTLCNSGGMTLRERLDMQDELRIKRLFKNKKSGEKLKIIF